MIHPLYSVKLLFVVLRIILTGLSPVHVQGVDIASHNDMGESRVDAAHNALLRYHLTSPAELERSCYTNKCEFTKVLEYISDPIEAGKYWSILNCVKFGITCGSNGEWQPWLEWEDCSSTCGVGEQIRWRECKQEELWGERCEGGYSQVRNCTRILPLHCAVNPAKPDTWGSWSEWTDCDVTCGSQGRVNRSRECLPYHDPWFCVGDQTESRGCSHVPVCPVDGGWTTWGTWSGCEVMTCGRGWRMRTRSCSNPTPRGTGAMCVGPSSQHIACDGDPCPISERPTIAHLTEHSSILYRDQPPSQFLSVFIRFRPITSRGTLFRYTGISSDYVTPVTSTLVKVTDAASESKKFNFDFVVLKLDGVGHVTLLASINGSDVVDMECGKIKIADWNVVRLFIVSDVVNVRVNNGANMVAPLRDTPGKPRPTNQNDTGNWWNGLWGYIDGNTAQSAAAGALRRTRAILSSFRGSIGLGKVRKDDTGIRCYISLFRVNYEDFKFTAATPTSKPIHLYPLASKGVELLTINQNHRPEGLELLYFDGELRVHVPFTLKWWKANGTTFNHGPDFKYTDVTSDDIATLEVTFRPYCRDGIIWWNKGARDHLSQLKLMVEHGIRAKFVSVHGGQIKILLSDDVIRLRHWNKVLVQFLRDGEVRMQVNNGTTRSVVIPTINDNNKPGATLVLGGSRKNLFKYDDNQPLSATERSGAPFRGHIYSVKQDGREILIDGREMIDVEGRPTSLFATAPMHWKSWFFEPVVPEMTSKATSRQLHCVLPLSNDVTPITWYKDEAPIAGNPLFEVQVVRTTSQIRSTIILKPSEDGSKGQSGVYSCVVKSGSKHWVLMNHVVAVLNPEIITPGGMASILNFIKDTTGSSDSLAVYIALGSISGVCFLLISAVSARNYCKKRIQQKRRLKEDSKKSGRSTDRTPLVKTKSRSKKRHNPRPSTGGRGTESDGSDWLLQAEIDRDVDDIDLYEDMIYS